MTSAQTASRVKNRLQESPASTALDLAKEMHLSAGTLRPYLYSLVADGVVEREVDRSVPSPRGGGAFRYTVLVIPLGPPVPTADDLCETCVEERYRDELRYERAMTRPLWTQRLPDIDEADPDGYDRLFDEARCDGCGGHLFNFE